MIHGEKGAAFMQAIPHVKETTVVICELPDVNPYALEKLGQILQKADELAKIPNLAKVSGLFYGIFLAKSGEVFDATAYFIEWLNEEETFCKLDFNPSKEGGQGFLTLAFPVEKGFSRSERIRFFMDIVKHPLLSGSLVPSISVALGIVLCKDGRVAEAKSLMDGAMKSVASKKAHVYLMEGAREAIELLASGKEVPPYLNFFIGKGNDYFADKFCPKPFNDFEISPTGEVFICCPNHLPRAIGIVETKKYKEIINSNTAIKIRKSILEGNFKYCNAAKCPTIRKNRLNGKGEVKDPRLRAFMGRQKGEIDHVRGVRLSFDPTCNLSCPSCRKAPIVAKGEDLKRIERVTDEIVIPVLRDARSVMMNGYGDVFTSKSCRKLLSVLNKKDFPSLKINIISNAVLFTEKEWGKFPNIHDMMGWVRVSIDAVREETYKVLRRGGDFKKLCKNLLFISELRQKGMISGFEISYVYQKENMHEMAAFVEWGEALKCDIVHFEPLFDWNSYEYDEYLQRAVHLQGNPLYDEFMEIIHDPVFKRDCVMFDHPAFASG